MGHRTSYALPILRINDACIEGLEWVARFSRANPGLGGIVPPELIRAAFENYICRLVPKPGSIMRKIFFGQVSPAIFEFSQTCDNPCCTLLLPRLSIPNLYSLTLIWDITDLV